LQTPIEFGSLEIVIIKSTDTILKVITSVLYIPSFQWYLWLILLVVVHVVSFSTMACNENQLQPHSTIIINSEHATHCQFIQCHDLTLCNFDCLWKLISRIPCCCSQPIQLYPREGSSSDPTFLLGRYNMASEIVVGFASDMMEHIDVEADISSCYSVVNGYEPSSPSLISSTGSIEEPTVDAVEYC
jgi:hypothetical protein